MPDPTTRTALIAALTERLRHVCQDWPDDVFRNMVEHLADITIKYEGRLASDYDRRSGDRLVAELKDALERSEAVRDGEKPGGGSVIPAVIVAVTELLQQVPKALS